MLDYTADEAALGKPIGGDLREGKVTLPVILLLQRTGPDVAALIQRRRRRRRRSRPRSGATIKDLLARHGAIDAAFERAVALRGSAPSSISPTRSRPRPSATASSRSTDYVLSRDR